MLRKGKGLLETGTGVGLMTGETGLAVGAGTGATAGVETGGGGGW